MRTLLYVLLAYCLAAPLFAQVIEPIAETELTDDGKKIFLHSTTGIPILQTMKGYIGLNPIDGSIIWELDRNAGAAFTEATDADGANRDFEEIGGTPFVFASGNLINVTNGQLLIDGTAQELKILRTYYFLPDEDLILFEIGGKGAVYLYGVDPFEGEAKWNVKLRDLSGLSQLTSEENAGQDEDEIQPQLNAAGNLIYPNDKYLAMVDLSTGELKWNEKFNAGYIFTNSDGSRMVIAEKRGGLGLGLSGGPRKFGKEIYLIDTETGESIWKKKQKLDGNVIYITPYDNGFLVVHDEGMNIYDYDNADGDGRWRKDYKMNGLRNVEITDEGLMTYTRNKRMLVDPATGEDLWRREERLEREPRGFLWGLSDDYEAPEPETIGNHQVTMHRSYFEVEGDQRYSYDWVLVEADRIAFVNYIEPEGNRIGRPQYNLYVLELGGSTPELNRQQFGIKKGLSAFDRTESGYFLFNDRGFSLFNYSNGDFTEIKDEWYPDPTAATRFLVGAATAVGGTAYAVGQSQRMITNSATSGNVSGSARTFEDRMTGLNAVGDVGMSAATDRQINGQIDEHIAFFFSRDGSEGLTLFKIDKNTGEEISKFRFDDRTPLYQVDYLNNRLYYQANKLFKVYQLN